MFVKKGLNISDRRGNISVEFALIAVLFFLPLFAGVADFIEIISAQAEAAGALHSFDLFAWSEPSNAGNIIYLSDILTNDNMHSSHLVTFPDGKTDLTTNYNPTISYGCIPPASINVTYQSNPCPIGYTQQEFVSYTLISSTYLTLPLPIGLASPFTVQASGTVQIQ